MAIGSPESNSKDGMTIKINGWVAVILLFVGYVGYNEYNKFSAPTSRPDPVPIVPAPGQKTLGDLVSPEAGVYLADLYHAIANHLYTDKGRVGKEGEGPQTNTIGEFYALQNSAAQNFNNATTLTGLEAIKGPIGQKLKVATGSLNPSMALDDPATKVRDSLIAACKQISEEFDPRYRQVALGSYKGGVF